MLVTMAAHAENAPRMLPRPGDVVRVTRTASVQFASPLVFRVIRVHERPTYHGWCWLDGYELKAAGDAMTRRCIFVQVDGLQRTHIGSPPNRYRAGRTAGQPPVRGS
jgi:hypothetical protein